MRQILSAGHYLVYEDIRSLIVWTGRYHSRTVSRPPVFSLWLPAWPETTSFSTIIGESASICTSLLSSMISISRFWLRSACKFFCISQARRKFLQHRQFLGTLPHPRWFHTPPQQRCRLPLRAHHLCLFPQAVLQSSAYSEDMKIKSRSKANILYFVNLKQKLNLHQIYKLHTITPVQSLLRRPAHS